MNIQNKLYKSEKKVYSTPVLEIIRLDNEIALILGSAPAIQFGDPIDTTNPDCSQNNLSSPDYFKNNPFA